jgi:lambda family phage portal protein
VEVDASGMVVAYFVHSTYPWEATMAEDKWLRVETYGKKTGLPNILHVMSSERPDQYRGVTYLAQVMEPLLQLRRYTDSALMMALVQSYFTAWIITKSNPDVIPFNETGDGLVGVPGANPAEAPRGENEYGMGVGTVNVVPEGEDVKFGNPTMPVASFDAFIKTFSKLVGAGLGIPYDVLVKEYNSSYSAARAALLDAWEDFRMRRKWFVDDFCQPVYESWLAEAVARGRVNAPGFFDDPLIRAAWCSAQWIGPVQGSLDPLKEANAAVIQIQHALKTHEQVTMEVSGGDWDANVEQLAAENEKLTAAGGGAIQLLVDPNKEDDDEGGESK